LLLLGFAAAVLGVLIVVCRKTPSKVLGDGGQAGGSPLRVAFVHPDLGIGGAENLMVNAAVALQKKGHTVHVYTAHHDVSHCFAETRGDGALARCISVHGDWLPRSLLRTGKGQVLCAIARTAFASLVLLLTGEADVIFVDQVRCSRMQLLPLPLPLSLPAARGYLLGRRDILLPLCLARSSRTRRLCYAFSPSSTFLCRRQVSAVVPLLRLSGAPVLFYCHFPDKLLCVERSSALKRLYRAPIDALEEATTAAADMVVVNSAFTASIYADSFPSIEAAPDVLYPPINADNFTPPSTAPPAASDYSVLGSWADPSCVVLLRCVL
jgi:hypothetical protein